MAYESLPKIAPALFSSEQDLIEVYNKKTDTVGVINPSQISTPLPNGVLSVDNPLSSTLQAVEDKNGTPSALNISTQRVGITSDPSVTTQTSSVIQATTTNASLVIAPNGTGALVAQIPNGLISGGDARGINAVDFQMSRTGSAQVASGNYSTVLNGISALASGLQSLAHGTATASGSYSVALGGRCLASGSGSVAIGGEDGGGLGATASGRAAVAFGLSNTATANFSNSLGGLSNNATSLYSTVSGGQSNTASTGSHATVSGGFSNTASGQYATVTGGQSNTASGNFSLAHGFQCVASATGSAALNNGVAASQYSMAINGGSVAATASDINGSFAFGHGASSRAYLYAMQSNAGGSFSGFGQSQQSNVTARRQDTLTTGGTTILSLDGSGTTNFAVPEGQNRMWNVQVRWVAVVSAITGTATGVTVGDTKVSTDLLAVAKRVGVTTVGAHTSAATSVIENTAGSLTAANIAYSAGASQQMQITFTGPTFVGGGSVTMRVVAAISLTEVAY